MRRYGSVVLSAPWRKCERYGVMIRNEKYTLKSNVAFTNKRREQRTAL